MPSRRFELVMLAQIVVGAVAATIALGDRPFWHDEVASVSVAQRSFSGIFDVLGNTDANSGLYYLVLHAWMWGGDSETWVRVLSVLCVVATIPVTALLARRLFGDAVGMLAGFLLAGNAFLTIYAQQARAYGLTLLLTTLATLLFVEMLRRDRGRLYVGYAIAAVLAIYATLFSGLVILAHFLSLLFLPGTRDVRARLAATYGAIVLATAPLAFFLLTTASGQVTWIASPQLADLPGTAESLLAAEHRALAAVVGVLVLIGLIATWFGERESGDEPGQRRWRFVLVGGWLVLPPLLLFAFSYAKPLFLDRYVIAVVPVIAILASVGLVAIAWRSRVLAVLAAVGLIALSVQARVEFAPVDNEDLRGAADEIAQSGRSDDGLAFAPAFARVGLDWYLEREPDGSELPDDFGIAPDGEAEQVGDLYAREVSQAEMVKRLRTHQRVWVVGYPDSDWHPTPEPMLDAGLQVLRSEYTLTRSEDFDGVVVDLYERKPAP